MRAKVHKRHANGLASGVPTIWDFVGLDTKSLGVEDNIFQINQR